MQDFMQYAGQVLAFLGDGYDMTMFLIYMVIVDTVLALLYRVTKGQPLWSSRFLTGLSLNITISMLPLLFWLLNHVVFVGSTQVWLDMVSAILTVAFAAAFLQSILANWFLMGYAFPAALEPFVKKYLGEELLKKVSDSPEETMRVKEVLNDGNKDQK